MPVFTPELIARHAATIQAQQQPDPSPSSQGSDGRGLFRKVGLPALIGGNVADLATTLQAISSGRGHEANNLMGSSPARIAATKAGVTAAEAYALDHLAKNHRTAALLTALGIGGLGAGLAAHNAKVGR